MRLKKKVAEEQVATLSCATLKLVWDSDCHLRALFGAQAMTRFFGGRVPPLEGPLHGGNASRDRSQALGRG